ncbi:HipA domain-containing protein [Butyrivibrio sp. XPD2002]|uniref:HipA domain-containing protein n=1 Tax=Butyrivibrio sp. XPD2002 TaxID=1280665 RepID=UPI00042A149D|nr:HipA domain-containing protein [Butyrivibrio sp. XPD2002]
MRHYNVYLEIDGSQVKVGEIEGNSSEDASFSYSKEYVARTDSRAISVSLPIQEEPFSPERTKIFFDGLLPEGFMRKSIATNMHFDENDYLSILYNLGKECLGAIRIDESDEEQESGYEAITSMQVEELAAEGTTKSTEIVIKTHLSLTGASGKVGLYYDEKEGRWYLPCGLAPSTHIVKQSHIRLDGIVTNEQLSMLTAHKCGIDIPESFIINVGQGTDSQVLFATKRYDRIIDETSQLIGNLKRPFRVHQEDFAQAMGVAAFEKYETDGQNYAEKMFEIIRNYARRPLEDQLRLWDRIVFNFVLGNTDAHIKNYSLLYDPHMEGISLAPAYDMISTVIYESATKDMSFNIGGIRNLDSIDEDSFKSLAAKVGIGEKIAMSNYHKVLDRFENAVKESAEELKEMGFVNAGDIAERILLARKKAL